MLGCGSALRHRGVHKGVWGMRVDCTYVEVHTGVENVGLARYSITQWVTPDGSRVCESP